MLKTSDNKRMKDGRDSRENECVRDHSHSFLKVVEENSSTLIIFFGKQRKRCIWALSSNFFIFHPSLDYSWSFRKSVESFKCQKYSWLSIELAVFEVLVYVDAVLRFDFLLRMLVGKEVRLGVNNMVYVENAIEVEVDSSDEALELFCRGQLIDNCKQKSVHWETLKMWGFFYCRAYLRSFMLYFAMCNKSTIFIRHADVKFFCRHCFSTWKLYHSKKYRAMHREI